MNTNDFEIPTIESSIAEGAPSAPVVTDDTPIFDLESNNKIINNTDNVIEIPSIQSSEIPSIDVNAPAIEIQENVKEKNIMEDKAINDTFDKSKDDNKEIQKPKMYDSVLTRLLPENTYENAPIKKLDSERSVVKFIILTLITFGIYAIIFMRRMGKDLNTMASREDGQRTADFILAFFLASPTFGLYPFVWQIQFTNRINHELKRRDLEANFNAKTFALSYILIFISSLLLVRTSIVATLRGTLSTSNTTVLYLALIAIGFLLQIVYFSKLFKSMNNLSLDYNLRG